MRDRVPMTKEEVRDVSICKLKLHKELYFMTLAVEQAQSRWGGRTF